MQAANQDDRDILDAAENPREFRLTAAERKALPPRKLEAIRRRDKRQYQRWLKRQR